MNDFFPFFSEAHENYFIKEFVQGGYWKLMCNPFTEADKIRQQTKPYSIMNFALFYCCYKIQ